MKNLKKVLFVVVFILIAFVGGMFFANKPNGTRNHIDIDSESN